MDGDKRTIYADHAATAPLRPEALAAMEPWLHERFGNPSGQYRLGLEARRGVEQARRRIAAVLDCRSEEIYFTSGGSEGNTWAVWTAALAGGRLVTTPVEHHSLLNAAGAMAPLGLKTELLPVDGAGRVDPAALAARLGRDTAALVSVQWVNNEVGTVQDMAAVAAACRAAGARLHTDAVQAAGHLPLRLEGIDYLTASAHKFGGPKGIGFLRARRGAPLRPFICGGRQESGLRGGTENVAAIVGMAAALEAAVSEMASRAEALRRMAADFCGTLRAGWPQARFHSGPDGLPGLVSAAIPGRKAEELVYRMDMAGVALSAGAACDSGGTPEPSHVLTAMGLGPEEALCTIRLSFGPANRAEDGTESARRLLAVLAAGR